MAIEQDESGGGSALLGVEPSEESVFTFERLILERVLAAQQIGAPFQVGDREGLEGVASWKARPDVSQGDLHWEENNAGLTN